MLESQEQKRLRKIITEQQIAYDRLCHVNDTLRHSLNFILERKPIYKLFF